MLDSKQSEPSTMLKNSVRTLFQKRRKGNKNFKTFYLTNTFKKRQSQFMNNLNLVRQQSKRTDCSRPNTLAQLNISGTVQNLNLPTQSCKQKKNKNFHTHRKHIERTTESKKSIRDQNCQQSINCWQSENKQCVDHEQEENLMTYQNEGAQEKARSHSYCLETYEHCRQTHNISNLPFNDKKRSDKSFLNFTFRSTHRNFGKNSSRQHDQQNQVKDNSQLVLEKPQDLLKSKKESPVREKKSFSCQKMESDESKGKKTMYITRRKKYKTSLDKCRVMTESYDELKQQIIAKIKLKHSSNRYESKSCFPGRTAYRIGGTIIKEKQNGLYTHKNMNFGGTGDESRQQNMQKITRYADISVAEFLDKTESEIDNSLLKRIGEMKKQSHRPRSKTQ